MNTQTIKAWGDVQESAVEQMRVLLQYGDVYDAALMADHHFGYSQPVGGVVAYRNMVSVSGVGYDIGCGNKAVRLGLTWGDIKNHLPELADRIYDRIEFGLGGAGAGLDHPLFEDADRWAVLRDIAGPDLYQSLRAKARQQLGSIGSGNHYVDVFAETGNDGGYGWNDIRDSSPIWIGVHFGSRGFGWNIASGFLKIGLGHSFDSKKQKGENYDREDPTLFGLDTDEGRAYQTLMELAGSYAYAGRDIVCSIVAAILDAPITHEVHNHHNYAWHEEHGGEQVVVVRKGATPLFPGQQSFIGGSMCDDAVIVQGLDTHEAIATLRSTVHGAGRVMGRMQAAGKECKRCFRRGEPCAPGDVAGPSEAQPCDGSGWTRQPNVTQAMMDEVVSEHGVVLRGAGRDESPFVYRRLHEVLAAHAESTQVLHRLRPVIVCMAGAKVRDPYKD